MRRLTLLGLLMLGACLEINAGGADGGAATASPASDAAGPEAATTSGCATDSATGLMLCTAISLCPSLAVDHDLYPHCGFRPAGNTLDLECVCGDYLCPVGTALS